MFSNTRRPLVSRRPFIRAHFRTHFTLSTLGTLSPSPKTVSVMSIDTKKKGQPNIPRLESSDRGRLQQARITPLVSAHCRIGHRALEIRNPQVDVTSSTFPLPSPSIAFLNSHACSSPWIYVWALRSRPGDRSVPFWHVRVGFLASSWPARPVDDS